MTEAEWPAVGGRVWFAEERHGYTVRARDDRYLICTKPFNLQDTVLYCIVDLEKGIRGPENLVFGLGAETDEQCEEMLARLNGEGDTIPTEVSQRRFLPIHLVRSEGGEDG